jgi:two-component system response regulator VicR
MTKILLVDDEKLFVKGLSAILEHEGFQVTKAFDGEKAWELIQKVSFALILLDLMLPKIDGLTLCREIRKKSDVPIIMLTAKGEDIDKIIGLELGADDYLAKPFNSRELLARIRAVLRRSSLKRAESSFLAEGEKELIIDREKWLVMVEEKEVELTGKEFDLLELLWKNPGRVFTREKLLELVWGYDFWGDERTVDVHIRRLREKIEPNPGTPRFVLTKWGVGYYFREKKNG